MFAVLSSVASNATEGTFLEKAALGANVTVIGLIITFVALIALIFITLVYPKVTEKAISFAQIFKKNKKKIAADNKNNNQNIDAKPAEENFAEIAAIAAAVYCTVGTASNGIVIKSIKRTKTNIPVWSANGRSRQLLERL